MVTKVANLRPDTRMIDPDVKVPEAVKRAAAAAEAAQLAAYPDQVKAAAEPPPPQGKDGIVIAEPPPAPPVTPQGNEAPPAPAAPEPAPVKMPAPADEQTWEQRFKSERGRHATTQTQLQQAIERLTSLENVIHDIQQTRAAPAPTPAPQPPAPTRLVSEKEEDEFGTEMLDVMGRRAREIVSPELTAMRAEMEDLKQRLTGTVQRVTRNARQDMLNSLDTRMPDWRQVNEMAEFKAWLALQDPYFGVNRHSALLQAFEQNDTPRVLNFFKGFVSELAATTPAQDLPAALSPPQSAKPGLETLAAPGRARTPAQTSVPAEKQIITTADINAFYNAKARGMYVGREAEFNALEQELFKAQREGRVRAV